MTEANRPDTLNGKAAEERVLPERAVEALARHMHDRNNDHGWYDPECLRYPDDHREPYHRLYAKAGLLAVLAAGYELTSAGTSESRIQAAAVAVLRERMDAWDAIETGLLIAELACAELEAADDH